MGITNFESNVRTMLIFMKENMNHGTVTLKTINTGSYKYIILAIYSSEKGLNYAVRKEKTYGKLVEIIEIDRVSIHGLEYRHNSKGSLPDSVVKEITSFHKEIMKRTGNYK